MSGSEYDPLEDDGMWDGGADDLDEGETLAADVADADQGEHPDRQHTGSTHRPPGARRERRQRRRARREAHRELHEHVKIRPMPPGMAKRFRSAVSVQVNRKDGIQVIFVRTEDD